MIVHEPSEVSGWGGFKFGTTYAPSAFTNGPVGETNYTDDVWAWGINNAGSGTRLDTSKPALYIQMESKYNLGANPIFGSEFHVQFISADGTNTPRLISGYAPHTGTTGGLLTFIADTTTWIAWDNSTVLAQLTTSALSLQHSQAVQGETNNVAMVRQKNAAGSGYVELLRADQGDVAKVSAPLYVRGNRAGSAADFPGIFAVFDATSANDGDIGICYLLNSALTGTINAFHAEGSASAGLKSWFWNTNGSSGSAHSWAQYLVQTGGGDPYINFETNGVTDWSIGLDNSDSDKFKVSNAGTLGTNDRLTIDANTVTFGLPPKLPSFTVAGVPSASTAGAGAMIYVSDESGGAVPAFSDGTNWRRVTDRVIIS